MARRFRSGRSDDALEPERIGAPGRPDRGNPKQHGFALPKGCKAREGTSSVPARAVSFVERRDRKNVRHRGAFTTWRTREQMAISSRGIDAEPEYWHAPATPFRTGSPELPWPSPHARSNETQALRPGLRPGSPAAAAACAAPPRALHPATYRAISPSSPRSWRRISCVSARPTRSPAR